MVSPTRDKQTTTSESGNKKIAIVGMSCLFPGAPNVATFWQNIVNGVDSTRDATESEWDPQRFFKEKSTSFEDIYCKRGGFITELADFDSLKYGVMPNSIPGSDPDQLLALKVASEALADAGYDQRRHELNNHEVILGRTSAPGAGSMNMIQRGQTVGQIMAVLKAVNPSFTQEQFSLIEEGLKSSLYQCNSDTIPAVMPNVLAGRIAGRLGFKGRSMILDSACASSLMAVDIAISDLLSGHCDLALAGGLHVNAFAVFYQMFCGLGALSRQQQIRPFDESADGTILGEGLGMVVLKRLDDAVNDGDRIYAVICGIGTSSDGQGTSMLAPSVDGEALALSRAYEMAQVSPKSVMLLEAHGTGTPSGDVVEMQAIEKVYGSVEDNAAWCAIGSVKSNVGHCQAASGIAGLIKAVLSLYYRVLPPTLHVDKPNSKIDWSRSPCYVNTEARSWTRSAVPSYVMPELDAESINRQNLPPRRAAVSAFGFGGVNAHVVLEEFAKDVGKDFEKVQNHKQVTPDVSQETELCVFAGRSSSDMVSTLQNALSYVENHNDLSLRNVSHMLAKQTNDLSNQSMMRMTIVAYSVADLRQKIGSAISRLGAGETNFSVEDIYCAAPVNGQAAAAKGNAIRLDLQYPEVSLPPATAQQVLALSPSQPAYSSAETETVLSSEEYHPEPVVDPVLHGYLTSMSKFQRNLIGLQQQVMVAYLTQQEK